MTPLASDNEAVPRSRQSSLLVFLMLALASPVAAQEVVTGTAEVIDADILKIGTQRVILWGIDAPERTQGCGLDGALWGCYEAARRALELLSGRGEISCTLLGEADPFGRRLGLCLAGAEDIGAEMVRHGMALAYSDQTPDYEPIQIEAITAGIGLWHPGVQFVEPWIFRMSITPGGFR